MSKPAFVNGSSWIGSISMISNKFVATASLGNDGIISDTVRPISTRQSWADKLVRWPIPRLLLICILLFETSGRMGKIAWIALIGAVCFNKLGLAPEMERYEILSRIAAFSWFLFIPLTLGLWLVVGKRVRSWHGAEHKAIACYKATGSTNKEDISKHDRVHPMCGTRYLVCIFLSYLLATVFFWSMEGSGTITSIALWGTLEIFLWVDYLYGVWKIPGIAHLSFFLQRHLTTREPGEQELEVAERALNALFLAHEREG